MAPIAARPARSDQRFLKTEIARLRNLDLETLRNRWRTVFRRRTPRHLPRHLLLRMLAYQLQADQFGDLDDSVRRLLEGSPIEAAKGIAKRNRSATNLGPGTRLVREWSGKLYRITVLPGGFSWNGKVYPNLSKVAFAITGTRWNGPRFFGLRDGPRPQVGSRA
jgi:hypothetical protein